VAAGANHQTDQRNPNDVEQQGFPVHGGAFYFLPAPYSCAESDLRTAGPSGLHGALRFPPMFAGRGCADYLEPGWSFSSVWVGGVLAVPHAC
jgi:hypothetical protein